MARNGKERMNKAGDSNVAIHTYIKTNIKMYGTHSHLLWMCTVDLPEELPSPRSRFMPSVAQCLNS